MRFFKNRLINRLKNKKLVHTSQLNWLVDQVLNESDRKLVNRKIAQLK